MNTVSDPASLPLRDIHLPGSVSWWPPAPGWWLLLLLLAALFLCFRWWLKRRRAQRLSVACLAKQEITRIRHEFEQHQDKARLARELSELLRRISISVFPRQDAASLTGEAWLQFLDGQTQHGHFMQGEGHILIEAPYLQEPDYDTDGLLSLVEGWVVDVTGKPGAGSK